MLSWLKKGNVVKVSKRCLVAFSIGSKYIDEIWCDVLAMDACHLLLGRPWQYDRKVAHDGDTNTYALSFGGTKIVLLPSKEVVPEPQTGEGTTLLTRAQFEELSVNKVVFVLVTRESSQLTSDQNVPTMIRPFLKEFQDVFPDELPKGLPSLRDI